MKKKIIYTVSAIIAVSFFASNQGCNITGNDGVATFDEVICGHSNYDNFKEENPYYTPVTDQEVWISETAEKKASVKRKYEQSYNTDAYMTYPLKSVAMASVNDELFYFFTYLPESNVYAYESLEEMVVVVYNCMGRKVKSINYEETSAGDYEDVVEELYEKSESSYFYGGYYIIDLWNVN